MTTTLDDAVWGTHRTDHGRREFRGRSLNHPHHPRFTRRGLDRHAVGPPTFAWEGIGGEGGARTHDRRIMSPLL